MRKNRRDFGKRLYEPSIFYSMVDIAQTLPCRVILQTLEDPNTKNLTFHM